MKKAVIESITNVAVISAVYIIAGLLISKYVWHISPNLPRLLTDITTLIFFGIIILSEAVRLLMIKKKKY